jgi:predicted O-methyltransferase YrrM
MAVAVMTVAFPRHTGEQASAGRWTDVDDYLAGLLTPPDPILEAALDAGRKAGLPQIQVSAVQGKFLNLLARMQGASRILEVGTLAGYSTIWLARALPADGRLVTLELDPKHAQIAGANIRRAALDKIVEVRVGPALESLAVLAGQGAVFDFVFIDADKALIPEYVTWSLRMSRPGSVIVVDNVVRQGAIIDRDSADPSVRGVRRMFELVAREPRLEATAMQTVGSKGHDGFALLRVRA